MTKDIKEDKTTYKDLAESFIEGQQNIDQMRKELKILVNGLLGFAETYGEPTSFTGFTEASLESEHLSWSLIPFKDINLLIAKCYNKENSEEIFNSDDDPKKLSFRNVKAVRKDVGTFTELIIKQFPELRDIIKPILDVAEKQF